MSLKRYSVLPKAPALLEPHHQFVILFIQGTHGRDLALCKDAVGVCTDKAKGASNIHSIIYFLRDIQQKIRMFIIKS